MAEIDLLFEVRRRVRNGVHSLCKELETAGIELSVSINEDMPDGITVTVAKSCLPIDLAEELPALVVNNELPRPHRGKHPYKPLAESEGDGSTGDE